MNAKKDVKELGEVLLLIAKGLKAYGVITEDGKFTISDLKELPALIKPAIAAVGGISEIPLEIKDIDETEVSELIDIFFDEFGMDDDKSALIIDLSLRQLGIILEAKELF